jgi:hypothetical protein
VVRLQGRPPPVVTLVAAGDRTRLAGRWTVAIASPREAGRPSRGGG